MVGASHHHRPLFPSNTPGYFDGFVEPLEDVEIRSSLYRPGGLKRVPATIRRNRRGLGKDSFLGHTEDGGKHSPPILVSLDPNQKNDRLGEVQAS